MKSSADLFDEYSACYEPALAAALKVSGERREYFACGRVRWLQRCLAELQQNPKCGLDFGCGDGSTTPTLRKVLNLHCIWGLTFQRNLSKELGPPTVALALPIARLNHSDRPVNYN